MTRRAKLTISLPSADPASAAILAYIATLPEAARSAVLRQAIVAGIDAVAALTQIEARLAAIEGRLAQQPIAVAVPAVAAQEALSIGVTLSEEDSAALDRMGLF